MRTRKNLLAGISSSVWTALVGLAVIPLYLKYLGLESYGLIGFFATLQALLVLLDLGIAPTINREVARYSVSKNISDAGSLLHSLAIIYWGIGLLIALVFFIMSPLIAEYWLQSNKLPVEVVENALMMMGVVVACRWPSGLYQSAVVGAQRLTVSSTINVIYVTLGSFGAVAILAFVSPTLQAFFIWQACVGLAYAITMRWAAWWAIGGREKAVFKLEELKRVWRFSAGMGVVGIFGVILMQLDKLILSKLLSLEEFGGYVLAGVVASSLYVLLTPVFNTIYPKLSALVATGSHDALNDLYRLGTRLLSSVIFPIALVVAFFSEDLIFIWTRDAALALSIGPIVSLLIVGTAINGVMHFPYALQLAFGMVRLPLIITVTLIVIFAPMTITMALFYGAFGGALSWLVLNMVYLCFGTWLTHRYILNGVGFKWFAFDVLLPFLLSLAVVGLGWMLVHVEGDYLLNVLWAGFLIFVSVAIVIFMMLRKRIFDFWSQYQKVGLVGDK